MAHSLRLLFAALALMLTLPMTLLTVGCSHGDDDDATDDDDSTGAALMGAVTRSVDLVAGQNGVGVLYVTVFDLAPGDKGPVSVFSETTVAGADFSDPGASVTYFAEGLPPRTESYFIVAFLDDDRSGAAGGPTAGDLRSDLYALVVDSTAPITQDMVLTSSGAPPGPPPRQR